MLLVWILSLHFRRFGRDRFAFSRFGHEFWRASLALSWLAAYFVVNVNVHWRERFASASTVDFCPSTRFGNRIFDGAVLKLHILTLLLTTFSSISHDLSLCIFCQLEFLRHVGRMYDILETIGPLSWRIVYSAFRLPIHFMPFGSYHDTLGIAFYSST